MLAIEHADARGAVEFVAGEDEEVATQRLHVEREVRGRLRGIDEDAGTDRLRAGDEGFDRVERPQRVG